MNKKIIILAISVIVLPVVAMGQISVDEAGSSAASTAPSVDVQASSATSNAPASDKSSSSATVSEAPSVDSVSSSAATATPSTDSSSSSAASSVPSTDSASSSAGPDSSDTTTTSGGGVVAPSSSSGSRSNLLPVFISAKYSTSSCPLITDYLKIGWNNDAGQVTKLQTFLKDVEGIDVAVNGTFDEQTKTAVEAFQKKYLNDVLGPWDATLPSGTVYITTLKKINQIACGTSLTFDQAQLSIIAKHIQDRDNGSSSNIQVGSAVQGGNVAITATGSIPVGPTIESDSSEDNVAAVGGASVLGRFWQFIKGLF